MHNNHGGLTGLQTGSAELVAFETRIIECTATTGAKKPAGCGQFVPAGIAAAVSALGESCMKLARPSDLRYAAEMLLAVDVNQQNTQSGRLAFLKDSATSLRASKPCLVADTPTSPGPCSRDSPSSLLGMRNPSPFIKCAPVPKDALMLGHTRETFATLPDPKRALI